MIPPPVSGEGIVLRVPTVDDVPALAAHAPGSAGAGFWLPTAALGDDAVEWASWFVEEVRRGWTTGAGRFGRGFVADEGAATVVGYGNFLARIDGVEVTYGVAPEHRGRGIATRMAVVATTWAVADGASRVELRIDVGHDASQRVAEKAGFVLDHVEDGDCVYVNA